MSIEDYPNLLILSKLIKPIDRSVKNIREWKAKLSPDMEKVFASGVFVMSVASMECMMLDVLKYYLKNFPQKLPASEFKYSKEDFLANYSDLLEKITENHVATLSFGSFENLCGKLLEYLSIEWEGFQESLGKQIGDIKGKRNSLLHKDLIARDHYFEQDSEKIKVDYGYALQSIELILRFEAALKERILSKYSAYTKINANKRLWKFMFTTPLMQYDDYWVYDEQDDSILAFKECEDEKGLSGSETVLLGLWRNQFTRDYDMKNFNMRSLSPRKVRFFISIAGDFDFY